MTKKVKYVDDLEKLIHEFEGASLDLGIDVLKEKLNSMLTGYACLTRYMESYYAFRARINDGSEFFDKTEDLWYPPK